MPSRVDWTQPGPGAPPEDTASPPDDPRGQLATITSGRSESTPVGVFAWVIGAVAVLFVVALVLVVIACVAA